jgi:hypothetical protein
MRRQCATQLKHSEVHFAIRTIRALYAVVRLLQTAATARRYSDTDAACIVALTVRNAYRRLP